MGRHTKLTEADDAPEESAPQPAPQQSADKSHLRWISRVPLLPAVAGVVAIGVCAAAYSTSQISLNFAGGGGGGHRESRQGSGVKDSALRARPARRTDGVVIAFQVSERTSTGFAGTVAIANRGSKPISGWTLAFKIPSATVQSASNAVLVEPGRQIARLRNSTVAPTIKPGQTIRVSYVARGSAAKPSACNFNRTSCWPRAAGGS